MSCLFPSDSGMFQPELCKEETGDRGLLLTDTQVSVLVEAWATLRTPSVHSPHTPTVRCLIADPVTQGDRHREREREREREKNTKKKNQKTAKNT